MPLLLAAAFGATCALSASSQETNDVSEKTVLTLDAAIRMALENNPALQASSARVDATAGRANQAGKWSNPELELSAEDWPVSGGRGYSNSKQTIGIVQSLPFPGKKSLDRKIGGATVKRSEAELTLRQTEVAREVKAAFYRVLASENLLEVSRQLLTVAESSAATAQKRVDAGAAAYQEQLRAEVQMEQLRAELAGSERELVSAQKFFATLLGRPELSRARLIGTLVESTIPSLTEEAAQIQLAEHPSLVAARANLDQAKLELRRARLEPYPDVKVGVSGGRIGETDESIIQLGFSLPLPIFDHGKGRIQEAQANVRVAEAELHAVQQQLQREWTNAQNRYCTAAEQVAAYHDRILPQADEALRLVRIGFEQGKFGFIDLADTQRTTAEVRRAYQEKLLELSIACAEMDALLLPASSKPSTLNQGTTL